MTYCLPGWTIDCCPIRSITIEEYQEASGKNQTSLLGLNIPDDLKGLIGAGPLSPYCNSRHGSYSGFKKDDFLYVKLEGNCFKIRCDLREKVANDLMGFIDMIRNGIK